MHAGIIREEEHVCGLTEGWLTGQAFSNNKGLTVKTLSSLQEMRLLAPHFPFVFAVDKSKVCLLREGCCFSLSSSWMLMLGVSLVSSPGQQEKLAASSKQRSTVYGEFSLGVQK